MAVRLTMAERRTIGRAVRADVRRLGHEPGYGIDDAAGMIETRVEALGRFDDVPYTEISDYALAFARFLYPTEARMS